jgi:hypothetical protein
LLKKETRIINPHIVYKQHQELARNLKQIQNMKQFLNKNERLSRDDVANIHIIHKELGFVHHITTAPDLLIIAYDKNLLEEMNNMLTVIKQPCIATYDTTFNIGDFYMSVFLLRHGLLEQEPAVPLFYLFHDRKFEENHLALFKVIDDVNNFV